MPKSSNEKIITDEYKVIDVLEKNAHENIDYIAKKCGFSRQKVWRIIKKLEQEKTIWGYTAICENETYGLKHYTLLVKRTTQPVEKSIINEILTTRLDDILPNTQLRMENIEFVHGTFDVLVSFWTDSLVTAKRFVERINKHFAGYVQSHELLETIITVRRESIRNPKLKEHLKYL